MEKAVKSATGEPTTRLIRFVLWFGKHKEEDFGYVIASNEAEAEAEARKRALRYNHRYVAPSRIDFEILSRTEQQAKETARAIFQEQVKVETPA